MKRIFKGKTLVLSAVALLVLLAGICIGGGEPSSAAGGNSAGNEYDEIQPFYHDNITINVLPIEIERVYPDESYFFIPNGGNVELIYTISNPTQNPFDIVANIDYASGVVGQPGSQFSYEFRISGRGTDEQYSPGSLLTVFPGEEIYMTVNVYQLLPAGQIFPLDIYFSYPYTPFG